MLLGSIATTATTLFGFWYVPTKTPAYDTFFTPGIDSRRCLSASGNGAPPTPAGCTSSKSALTFVITFSTPVFIPCNIPNSPKATATCKKIKTVRPGLRQIPAHMSGKYFIVSLLSSLAADAAY
jgi:hypothetical protein